MTAQRTTEVQTRQAVEQALRTIGTLFEIGDVIEIRALDVGRTSARAGCTYSGYFNFENELAISGAIASVDGRLKACMLC